MDFYEVPAVYCPMKIISSPDAVLSAYWYFWELFLGYDLRTVKNPESIYCISSQRRKILSRMFLFGYSRQKIFIKSAKTEKIILDSLFIKNCGGTWRVFLKV